jgi:hypothetical protein
MNKTYRSVWNETTGTWVAVQENASARSKSGGGKASRKFLPANAVMVAAGIGSFAFAQHAMAGSIENCGNGQSSYASFTNWTGTWGTVGTTGVFPQDCTFMPNGAAMPGSGVIISEDPNYFNPSSNYATILIGQTGSNGAAAGVVWHDSNGGPEERCDWRRQHRRGERRADEAASDYGQSVHLWLGDRYGCAGIWLRSGRVGSRLGCRHALYDLRWRAQHQWPGGNSAADHECC